MKDLRPGIAQIFLHKGTIILQGGDICLDGGSDSGIHGKGIEVVQQKIRYAQGFSYKLNRIFGVPLPSGSPVSGRRRYMPANIPGPRGAVAKVVGQSLGCCEGASHAPGF